LEYERVSLALEFMQSMTSAKSSDFARWPVFKIGASRGHGRQECKRSGGLGSGTIGIDFGEIVGSADSGDVTKAYAVLWGRQVIRFGFGNSP
jgi:hypothetical protein